MSAIEKGDAEKDKVVSIGIPISGPSISLPIPAVPADIPEQASLDADAAGLGEAGADSLTGDNTSKVV